MPLPEIAPQSSFLYIHNWDAKKDDVLLKCLIHMIGECKPSSAHLPSPTHLPSPALIFAMKTLNAKFNANFTFGDVEERVEFLRDRYVSFKYLCNIPETDRDASTNVLHASDEVWEQLFKENEFYKAYYHRGEPEYLKLCSLFGMYDVKPEISYTVIVIEDSSKGEKSPPFESFTDTSSEDEVNSPSLKPKPPANRKLFPDDACSSVSPSFPNSHKGHVYVPWSTIKNKFSKQTTSSFPPKNAFPVKPNDGKKDDVGYGGSSCASSSPFK